MTPAPITLKAAPYTMLRETSEQMTGNDRYEGFCVDLIKEISEILGFNFTLKIADDDKHGNFDKKLGRWNGMIGELLDQVKGKGRERNMSERKVKIKSSGVCCPIRLHVCAAACVWDLTKKR